MSKRLHNRLNEAVKWLKIASTSLLITSDKTRSQISQKIYSIAMAIALLNKSNTQYSGGIHQDLFNHLTTIHGLKLTAGEMDDIIQIVRNMDKEARVDAGNHKNG